MLDKMTILVVDDDVAMRETLSDILEIEGYEVVTANDGNEAIERMREKDFSFVLMDIKMPGMNSIQTYKLIKHEKSYTKVVLMTAYWAEELVQKAQNRGTVTILSKPLDIGRMMELLRTAVGFNSG